MQPGVESKLGGCEREMVVEEDIATETSVCTTYFGVLYVVLTHVHVQLEMFISPADSCELG